MSFHDISRWKSQWQVCAHGNVTRKVSSLDSLSQRNCLQITGFLHKTTTELLWGNRWWGLLRPLSPVKASGRHCARPASLVSTAQPFPGGLTIRPKGAAALAEWNSATCEQHPAFSKLHHLILKLPFFG